MGQRLVVIGASAGGLEALVQIFSALPRDFPAPICVALHVSADSPRLLSEILMRAGPLPARYAEDRQKLAPGHAYIALPDHHLIVEGEYLRLTRGPRENGFRPAIDPLFRSAALSQGRAVIGVLLSGLGMERAGLPDDGSLGLFEIKRGGGVAIVQAPDDARAPGMPLAALRSVAVDHVISAAEVSAVIQELVEEWDGQEEGAVADVKRPEDPAKHGTSLLRRRESLGAPTFFTCPDCGGTLWQNSQGEITSFHCHLGHRYTSGALLRTQQSSVESALWGALRLLEESAATHRLLAQEARGPGPELAESYEREAAEFERRADAIRAILTREPSTTEH
jgi:two-component system chemotaxis response regulator CheB